MTLRGKRDGRQASFLDDNGGDGYAPGSYPKSGFNS